MNDRRERTMGRERRDRMMRRDRGRERREILNNMAYNLHI
jgi:hypothetical protein